MAILTKKRFDDGNDIKHGAWLVLTNTARRDAIISGRALNELNAYGPVDTIRVTYFDENEIKIECLLSNIGEVAAHTSKLIFVIWGEGDRTAIYRDPGIYHVPSGRYIDESGEILIQTKIELIALEYGQNVLPFNTVTEVTHIFCIAYDVLRDPMDKERLKLLKEAKAGKKLIEENPSRTSTAIACCKLAPTFQKSGNSLNLSQETFVELVQGQWDAGADAGFGCRRQDGTDHRWIHSLKASPVDSLLTNKPLLLKGEAVFVLFSDLGLRFSSDSNACSMSLMQTGDTLKLDWEDGGGGQYDDYHLYVYEF